MGRIGTATVRVFAKNALTKGVAMAAGNRDSHSLLHLTRLALAFRDARDWRQFHTPKELAISLVVESAELLELMQWKQGAELASAIARQRQDVADEMGDCLHSLLLLAAELEIDLGQAFVEKLKKADKKYPAHKARGRAVKYNEL
jgi:NTP pyrophosphatase (non-canonical NTP hydrolase)